MKSYREVPIPKDPVKERLRAIKAKLKNKQNLTQKEIEEALFDLMGKIGIGD